MGDKFFNELLAEQTRQADRLIEMLDKIPDLLPTFTSEQRTAYEALEERRQQWLKTRDKGLNALIKLTEKEFLLRRLALLERDTEMLREIAKALAAIIRNEI